MKKRKKRKKRKKLTFDEREKKESFTGYPFLDGILILAGVLFLLKIALPIFFGE